jgi:hypothetical protein
VRCRRGQARATVSILAKHETNLCLLYAVSSPTSRGPGASRQPPSPGSTTAIPTPTQATTSGDSAQSDGLSTGELAGIIIGAISVVVALVGIVSKKCWGQRAKGDQSRAVEGEGMLMHGVQHHPQAATRGVSATPFYQNTGEVYYGPNTGWPR